MQALLTVIALWLSVNFGLPLSLEHPQVAFVSAEAMAEVRRQRLASGAAGHAGDAPAAQPHPADAGDVFAAYDDAGRTIYLPGDWTVLDPADVSLLVHEMAHHLQNAAGLRFACAGARERDAYRAQRAWLSLFGRTLDEAFGLDPMTVLVRTNCLH